MSTSVGHNSTETFTTVKKMPVGGDGVSKKQSPCRSALHKRAGH
jgi:hypothetical protein